MKVQIAVSMLGVATLATAAPYHTMHVPAKPHAIKNVLMVSVDGMHEQDLTWYIKKHPKSAFNYLVNSGVHYSNGWTSFPSDSFPGLAGPMTGASPRTHGLWYDDHYDRTLYPPGSACKGHPGTETLFDESIDINNTLQNGGGGINPAALPLRLHNGKCTPVPPHEFIRVPTIMNVARNAGLRTAWADKHNAYAWLNGPDGKGVEDLYLSEIASFGSTVADTEKYDDLHVKAALNWIHGKKSDGSGHPGTPNIYGFNLQAVSVAQKNVTGGYLPDLTPSPLLKGALDSADRAVGKMIQALTLTGQLEKTLIVLFAKHGQAPRDRKTLKRIPTDVLANATGYPDAILQFTGDDVGCLFFNRTIVKPSTLSQIKKNILTHPSLSGAAQVWAGKTDLVKGGFGNPETDPRVPDILIRVTPGVVYTSSTKKIAEHGGGNADDRHVALVVSNPHLKKREEKEWVETKQVGVSVLKVLSVSEAGLVGAKVEGTRPLPGL
ncbi:hypothetical protein HDV00_004997 [Rhizophlyctis rosea]|nr:hypothetical protein HDV00_004997 [Rhizophlyctis rosea]